MKGNKRGFTLAELLIVVAIIAVLVAVAIPVFTGQLEKSRESVDFSNMRSAYSQVMVAAIMDDSGSPLKQADGTFRADISLKQKEEGWQTDRVENMQIGSVPYAEWNSKMPAVDGTATVTFDPADAKVTINWGGSGSGSGAGPVFHGTTSKTDNSTFRRGAVIMDDTGACVIKSGMWETWLAYSAGTKVVNLITLYSADAFPVNASEIKDASSETLQAGDIYYDSVQDKFYYVDKVSLYESRPNGSWWPLDQ